MGCPCPRTKLRLDSFEVIFLPCRKGSGGGQWAGVQTLAPPAGITLETSVRCWSTSPGRGPAPRPWRAWPRGGPRGRRHWAPVGRRLPEPLQKPGRRAAIWGHSGCPPQDLRPPLPSAPSSLKLAKEDKEQKLVLLEEARVAVGKEAGELRAGLQEVERSRLEARRELQELRRQVLPSPRPPAGTCCGPRVHCTPFLEPRPLVYLKPRA